MDDSALRLVYVLTDLVAPLAAGYLLHQKHLLSAGVIDKLIKLNVRAVYTVLSALSFWVLPLSHDLLLVPLYGFLFVIFPGLVGLLFIRRLKNYLDKGAYLASAMLSNIGTFGGVCAFILYNEEGFAYAQLVGTCQNIMLVLVVFPFAQYCYLKQKGQSGEAAGRKSNRFWNFIHMFFSWNQLSLLGMVLGLLLSGLGVERPGALAPIFQSLVHLGAWTAMLPVGFLADFSRARYFVKYVLDLCALRFLAVPAFIFATSRLIFSDPVILNTFLILSATPTAINAVLTAKLYHLRVDLAVSSFIITTALYLLLVFPLLFLFFKT